MRFMLVGIDFSENEDAETRSLQYKTQLQRSDHQQHSAQRYVNSPHLTRKPRSGRRSALTKNNRGGATNGDLTFAKAILSKPESESGMTQRGYVPKLRHVKIVIPGPDLESPFVTKNPRRCSRPRQYDGVEISTMPRLRGASENRPVS